MRTLLCSLLLAAAQTMPQLLPAPAGSPAIDPNPTATSFTFVVAGDNRPAKSTCAQPPQLAAVVSGIAALKPAFALWDGDIVYGKNASAAASEYPAFFAAIAKAGAPVFVAPGNHELSLKGTIDCPVPGKKKKEKPIDEPDPSGQLAAAWLKYAGAAYGMFRYGNSAFIAVNTDDSLNGEYNPGDCGYNGYVGNAQLAALTAALNALQADAKVAHIFVFMHRPLNGSKSKDDIGPVSVPQIAKLYSLLTGTTITKLSFVFASHQHLFYFYDPTGKVGQKGPFKRTDPSKKGPDFIVTGGAGAPLSSGGYFHYLTVKVDGDKVKVTIVPITDTSTNCS
jgi:calcineurin-like phosphoesterase family protein